MALMGISMGGYLAAMAAAFEHRISACILYNGVYDGYDAFASSFPKSLLSAIENGNSELVNMVLGILMESDPNTRFNMKHGMWTAGVNTPFELIQQSKNYTIKDIVQNIKCPTLVLEAEKDDSFPGQPKKVYDALTCPKSYIRFTEQEGAEEHSQCGAPADDTLFIQFCFKKTYDVIEKEKKASYVILKIFCKKLSFFITAYDDGSLGTYRTSDLQVIARASSCCIIRSLSWPCRKTSS
jgi:hypothetical protein